MQVKTMSQRKNSAHYFSAVGQPKDIPMALRNNQWSETAVAPGQHFMLSERLLLAVS